MTLNTLSFATDPSWRKTVTRPSRVPSHFVMAVIFNLLNLIMLADLWKLYHRDPRVGYLDVFLLLVVWLLTMLDSYFVHLYQAAKRQLAEDATSSASKTLLGVSYLGYRLYLFGLGISFFILGSIVVVHL